jgi:4a-hydroxytetrahydrobiopterin dehydratase
MKTKTPAILTKGALKKEMKLLFDWRHNPALTQLSLSCTFKSHIDALAFIARVTVIAQVLDHHPDIHFSLQKVKLTIATKGAKGVTKKDIELAKRIDALKRA